MATLKVKFRPSAVAGKQGSLFYRITHCGDTRSIRTDYRLFASEWDLRAGAVSVRGCDPSRERELRALQERIAADTGRLERIIRRFERTRTHFSCGEIAAAYDAVGESDMLFVFMESVAARLRQHDRIRTSETYRCALRSFARFRGGRDMPLEAVDAGTMADYESYLRAAGVSRNTSSFYMRILRAVYNRAVEQGLVEDQRPFRRVYTGVDKTLKRAVAADTIRRIRNLDLAHAPSLDHARDMFLMSFYTRGMSFVDMAYLKKSDLENGLLTYRRRKTARLLHIHWEACMQRIVEKYPDADSAYLLPIIGKGGDERLRCSNAGARINRNLKKIGQRLGLPFPLTLYVARHSWANIARSRDIPVSVISESMGHDSEATTRIYLASLDSSVIARANRLVIDSI